MHLVLIIVGILLFLLVAIIFCIAPGKMSEEAKKIAMIFYGLYCAHRGLHSEDQSIPENSLSSFAAAKEAGYGVELDVQITKDNQIVVFHDHDLKRVCGVDKLIHDVDYSELLEYRLFNTGEKIPLLSEVLEVLDDVPIVVELKPVGGKRNAVFCQNALDILRKDGKVWCIQSFDPRIVRWFRKNAPDVFRGQLSSLPRFLEPLSRYTALVLGNLLTNFLSRPHYLAFSNTYRPLTVKLCRLLGVMNIVWTVRPDQDIERCERKHDMIIFEYFLPSPRYK
ncbi:MAG: glycerophosphodiester phosphodiesterase [Oscillospiraceae bacterium]|nr:glycerophosphodiester phosphodiesterase [Oscillospiraceae bacterium]